MDRVNCGAPLLSLDAVVIDTETTGLDPRKARVIELAGVRVIGGRLADDDSFRQLMRPGDELIPAETTRIHRIDDAMVACAAVRGGLAGVSPFPRLGRRDRAHGRLRSGGAEAGVRPRRPALDAAAHARHPAAGADRRARTGRLHAGKSRAWLGVEMVDRHSALGDAITTARIFLALVPKLREHGIRTVAEAERACAALIAVLDDQVRSGWMEAVEAPARVDAERTLERFDSYAYRHRNRDIMRSAGAFHQPRT